MINILDQDVCRGTVQINITVLNPSFKGHMLFQCSRTDFFRRLWNSTAFNTSYSRKVHNSFSSHRRSSYGDSLEDWACVYIWGRRRQVISFCALTESESTKREMQKNFVNFTFKTRYTSMMQFETGNSKLCTAMCKPVGARHGKFYVLEFI
jgi:hypothetical protein